MCDANDPHKERMEKFGKYEVKSFRMRPEKQKKISFLQRFVKKNYQITFSCLRSFEYKYLHCSMSNNSDHSNETKVKPKIDNKRMANVSSFIPSLFCFNFNFKFSALDGQRGISNDSIVLNGKCCATERNAVRRDEKTTHTVLNEWHSWKFRHHKDIPIARNKISIYSACNQQSK